MTLCCFKEKSAHSKHAIHIKRLHIKYNGAVTLNNSFILSKFISTGLRRKIKWNKFKLLCFERAALTFGHPVRCASHRCHGSAIHSRAPLSSSVANQETGWYLRARSTPLHTELTAAGEKRELKKKDSFTGPVYV